MEEDDPESGSEEAVAQGDMIDDDEAAEILEAMLGLAPAAAAPEPTRKRRRGAARVSDLWGGQWAAQMLFRGWQPGPTFEWRPDVRISDARISSPAGRFGAAPIWHQGPREHIHDGVREVQGRPPGGAHDHL
jgi:hypothetical protein